MEAKSNLVTTALAMLDELELQATISQKGHHFNYTVKETSGIGKLLTPDEQIDILYMLHSRGIIAGFGKDIYNFPKPDCYFIELEDQHFTKERDLVSSPDFFIGHTKAESNERHQISISLDGGTLFLKIDSNHPKPIARFSDGSKMRHIFTKLYSDKPGTMFKNTDFAQMGPKANLTQVFMNGRYGYLLRFMDMSNMPRAISLRTKYIEMTGDELTQFLMQINVPHRKAFSQYLEQTID